MSFFILFMAYFVTEIFYLTFVPHGYKNEQVEMRESINVRYRRQGTISLGHLGGSVHPTPTMTPTLVMYGQYRFSQPFSLFTAKACWEMQLLWESVQSPGHNSSVSDVEVDSFSGSTVLTAETINTWDCCACWLGHREFLSAVSVISLRGKSLPPIFEYGIPQCPQRPIVLHTIYGQKYLGEARGLWIRR